MIWHLTDITLTISTKEPLDEEDKDFVTGALEYLAELLAGEPVIAGICPENDDGETFQSVRDERDRLRKARPLPDREQIADVLRSNILGASAFAHNVRLEMADAVLKLLTN